MDEEKTLTEPTEEDLAFDGGWDDEPVADDDMDLSDEAESPEDQRAEAEEQPEEPKAADAEGEAADKPEEAEEQKPKSWKLKHNGQDEEADETRMVELAQKGLDYDRIREERDRFKGDFPKYQDYESFLNELAKRAETDVPGLMERTRANLLMQQAEAEGKTLTEEEALAQVRKAKPATEPEKAAPKPAEPSPEEKRRESFRAFLTAYPDVKPEAIPKEVWAESQQNGDLVGAYTRWENRQLKAKLENMERNQANKERSTGPRKSAGTSKPKDDFDEAWDSF